MRHSPYGRAPLTRRAEWLVYALCITTVLLVLIWTPHTAHATSVRTPARPCGMGGGNAQNRRLAICLSREPGIHVSRAEAVKVGNCESGFNAAAHNSAGPYDGIYQLLPAEFATFQHQGPAWVTREFNQYGYHVHSARGNILATFAHTNQYGWGYSSCA